VAPASSARRIAATAVIRNERTKVSSAGGSRVGDGAAGDGFARETVGATAGRGRAVAVSGAIDAGRSGVATVSGGGGPVRVEDPCHGAAHHSTTAIPTAASPHQAATRRRAGAGTADGRV
jgi:hypothetical protein